MGDGALVLSGVEVLGIGHWALEINFSLVPLVRLRIVCKCQLANTHLGDDKKCHLRCHN